MCYKPEQLLGFNTKPMASYIRLFLISLFFCSPAFSAPPIRLHAYVNDSAISSDHVSNNENAIFNYLQAGVDTYKDNTITNADIAASANIQSDKLNLSSIVQLVTLSGIGLRPAKVTADPCGNTTNYPEGSIFYNDTSDYMCYCNGSGADIKMSDTNACF